MAQIPKVKIVRAPEREGLIKARIRGTLAAKAPTLTFLDSHVECAPGWLEPLLERIALNSTTVVCPVIDVIDDKSLAFSYQSSEMLQIGGFEWEMTFTWFMVPQRLRNLRKDASEPVHSPTMAGLCYLTNKFLIGQLIYIFKVDCSALTLNFSKSLACTILALISGVLKISS
jgi:polypeptide N-acetylgalactosaminyltransferase